MPAFRATPPAGGLARLDWSVAEGTDAVILELGANDALRGSDPKVTRAALEAIIRRLKERAHRGAARRHAGAAQFRAGLRAGVRSRSIRSSRPRTTSSSIRSSSRASPATAALNQPDGLHPTAAGVDVMVQRHAAEGRGADRPGEGRRSERENPTPVISLCRSDRRSSGPCLRVDSGSGRSPFGVDRCLACSPAWKSPSEVAQIAVAAARRAAGRALDRSGELSHHAALHRRHRRPARARDRARCSTACGGAASRCASAT